MNSLQVMDARSACEADGGWGPEEGGGARHRIHSGGYTASLILRNLLSVYFLQLKNSTNKRLHNFQPSAS